MNKLIWITLPASMIIAGVGVYFMLSASPKVEGNVPNMAATPRHPVTDAMQADASGRAGKEAPTFDLPDSEGGRIASRDLLKNGPLVVVMTKDGCPCSIESQPFFNQISEMYKGKASFVGIIDANQATAQLYKRSQKVPYPIVMSETADVFKAFRAKQSVYVYLIGRDGAQARVWPGYSAPMLIDLNDQLAKAIGVPAKPITLKDAPGEMTSGCYFFEDDPVMKGL